MTWNDVPDIIRIAVYLLAILIPIEAVLIIRQRRRQAESPPEIPQIETATLNDMPQIVEALAADGGKWLWVMFVLHLGEPTDPDSDLTVQFSTERRHQVGFDWLTDNGLGDGHRERFEQLAEQRGWPVEEREKAGFHYLRVEGLPPSEIAQIGKDVLSTLYNIYPNQPVEIESDAPDWRHITA